MSELPRLDPRTRRWLKQEVSRRRKEKELHVGRPILYRYSKQGESAVEHALDSIATVCEPGAREMSKPAGRGGGSEA